MSSLLGLWLAILVLAQSFSIATAPYYYDFPRDHAAHDTYRTEWWYYTGHLQADDGRQVGFELTFFREALAPGDPPLLAGQSRWRGNQVYAAHFALSDIGGQHFFSQQRFSRSGLDFAGADQRRLAVHLGDWSLRRNADETIFLHAVSAGHRLDLTLRSEKPLVIHGRGGITRKGACRSCASHYYSYTRLAASGKIALGKSSFAVRGEAWMDHEYGSSQLEAQQVGWDWFSLQLHDRREVMFYRLRTNRGTSSPQSSGSLVSPDGHVEALNRSDFPCRVLSGWTSPTTHATYPSSWQCTLPKAGLVLTLVPRLLDQELSAPTPGSIPYWEGDVAVLDAQHHEIGTGYVELTGYAGPLRL